MRSLSGLHCYGTSESGYEVILKSVRLGRRVLFIRMFRAAILCGLVLCLAAAANADGKIKLALPGQSRLALLTERGSVKSISSADGVFSLPVGKYRVTGYSSAMKTKTGESWSVFATAMKPVSVLVKEDATTLVKVCEPFIASVNVSASASQNVNMDLETVGAAGESVSIYGPKPPGFQAINKTGGTVWSGSFHYG